MPPKSDRERSKKERKKKRTKKVQETTKIRSKKKKKHRRKKKRRRSTRETTESLEEVVIERISDESSSDSSVGDDNSVDASSKITNDSRTYCIAKILILTLVISVVIHSALAFWWMQNGSPSDDTVNLDSAEKKVAPAAGTSSKTDSPSEDNDDFDPLKEFTGPMSQKKKALETLKELNFARTEPKRYCKERIEPLVKKAEKIENGWYMNKGFGSYLMEEGMSVLEETIKYLNEVEPCPPLKGVVEPLCKSARDHCNDCGPKGITAHVGSDKSHSYDRIDRYCYARTTGENIMFGTSRPEDVVSGLIIDDGFKTRGHRHAIFEPEYVYLGMHEGWFDAKKAGMAGSQNVMVVHNMADIVLPLKPKAQTLNIKGDNSSEMKKFYIHMPASTRKRIKEGITMWLKDDSCHVRVTYDPNKVYDGDDKDFGSRNKTCQYLLVEKIGEENKVYASRPPSWYN